MTATLLPNGKQQFIDANGSPLVGGSVTFYIPNTSTLKNTWQDAGQTILNTNPVILDSRGQAVIYGSGQYRQLVKDASGNTIWDQLTQDVYALIPTSIPIWCGTLTGTANAPVASPSSAVTTLTAGAIFEAIAGLSNSGATTLQVSALSPLAVKVNTTSGLAALLGNEITAGDRTLFLYDGTQFVLLNPAVGVTEASGSNSTAWATTAWVRTFVGSNTPIKTIARQTFTSSGTYTPTSGLAWVFAKVMGAGGAGGGVPSGVTGGAGGGEGGQYIETLIAAATIGASQGIAIGAGGAGTAGGAGGNGGATSLGAIVTALGGAGAPASSGASYFRAFSGGYSGGGGAPGGFGCAQSFNDSGAAGGNGGAGFGGVGGGYGPAFNSAGAISQGHNGYNAAVNGSGGGGAAAISAGAGYSGGNGGNGYVELIEFCT
jgi:hypothetical protein